MLPFGKKHVTISQNLGHTVEKKIVMKKILPRPHFLCTNKNVFWGPYINIDISILYLVATNFRIVPNGTGNSVNNAGLNHYKSLVAELVKNDIIPVVTLFHWDFPQTLEDVGGLMNVSFIEPFVHYARVVIAALPEVPYWITFNEPRSICLYGYAKGRLAPATQQNVYQCAYVLVKAHAEVYHMYKQEFSHYKGN